MFDVYIYTCVCADGSRFSDMNMWAAFNGQERTAGQFEELVGSVPGLKIVQMSSPSALEIGIIEVEYVG